MLPAEEDSGESSGDPIRLFDDEHTRVLKHSHINNLTNIVPLTKQVMDIEKNFKSKKRTKRVSSSDSNKKNTVDFKRNTGLIGMKIFQKDIIVHDNDDKKVEKHQSTTRKNRKNNVCLKKNDCVKDVFEPDVYERIIGKAYDNLKTCDKPLEEICKMMDGKRPRKVCRSRSLCIPAVEKPNKSKNDVLMLHKTSTKTKEINFKSCDKNYSHTLKNIETVTQNQNIETHSRSKGKHTTTFHKTSPSIVSRPTKKVADTEAIDNNVTFKRNILERKNDANEIIPSKQIMEVNRKNIDPTTNHCKKVTSINTSVTKSTNNEKATATKRKIDDQDILSLAPKIAASISKVRRNTISSSCQNVKLTKPTKSEKNKKEKKNHANSNCNDHVAMSIVNEKNIIPTNSEKAIEVKNKKIKAKSNDNFAASSLGTTDIKSPNSEKAIGMKRKIEDKDIVSLAPKVAASISKIRRNTISSTCQIGELTKPTKSEKDMGTKRKLINSNYNDQITMSNVNVKITKSKAIEVINKNNDAYCNDRLTSSVDTNITKPNNGEKVAGLKRNIVRKGIDDQVIDSFPLKKAASISKRRSTISSTYPENTSLFKVSDKYGFIPKNSFRNEQIIPLYHKLFLLEKQTESENETIKRNITSELSPERTQTNRTNKDPYEYNQNFTNTTAVSQSVSLRVGPNTNNDVIGPNEPVYLPLDPVPRLPKPFPKYGSRTNENVPHNNINKDIDMTDGPNIEKLTEGKCDTIYCERTPVLLHKAPFPNRRSCNHSSPSFQIRSIVSSHPSQVFHTNNCLFPRSPHTSFSRSPGIRSWHAPYPSYSNYSNRIRDQYPIFNRMLNARAFAGNHNFYRTLTQLPVYEQSQEYLPSPSRLNSPCSPSNILITNNTSRKHTQQVVDITKSEPTIHNKVNKSLSESSAIQSVETSEATTEQSSNEKKCNESKTTCKKEYSPPILPILSYATILGILENSEYGYPYLKSRVFISPKWMYKEATNKPDLGKNKSEINDGGIQDKKTKITLSEYNKRRLSETTSENY